MTQSKAEHAQEIANKKASRRARKKQPKMKVSGSSVKKLQSLLVQKGSDNKLLDKER